MESEEKTGNFKIILDLGKVMSKILLFILMLSTIKGYDQYVKVLSNNDINGVSPVKNAKVVLLNYENENVEEEYTDIYGGCVFFAPRSGDYTILVTHHLKGVAEKNIYIPGQFENHTYPGRVEILISPPAPHLIDRDDYSIFLKSDKSLKQVGENYDIIKTELDKMLEDYKSKIDLDNYWKEKYSAKVKTGSSFNEDGYLTALLSMNNPSQADADYLKMNFIRSTYANVVKERNRIIERGDIFFTKEAKWNDIVSYVGGYAELSKSGLSKKDISKFNISVILEKIELTSSSTCLAHVILKGSEEALKFHKIPKSSFVYEGNYKFNFVADYLTLYNGTSVQIDFSFEEKEYLPKSKTQLIEKYDNSFMPSTENFRNTIITMLSDLIPETTYLELEKEKENLLKIEKVKKEDEWLKSLEKNPKFSDIKKGWSRVGDIPFKAALKIHGLEKMDSIIKKHKKEVMAFGNYLPVNIDGFSANLYGKVIDINRKEIKFEVFEDIDKKEKIKKIKKLIVDGKKIKGKIINGSNHSIIFATKQNSEKIIPISSLDVKTKVLLMGVRFGEEKIITIPHNYVDAKKIKKKHRFLLQDFTGGRYYFVN